MAPPAPTPTPAETAAAADALQARNEWFATTPDPWHEIGRLEFGGDRTHASTIERIVLDAEIAQRPVIEQRLVATLRRADLTPAGRHFVCRMLGWIGSLACVPSVAPLLHDPLTADDARLALDNVRGAPVTSAYVEALGRLRGAARLGLIGSLARRRDPTAVEALTGLAIDEAEARETRAAAEAAVKSILAKG